MLELLGYRDYAIELVFAYPAIIGKLVSPKMAVDLLTPSVDGSVILYERYVETAMKGFAAPGTGQTAGAVEWNNSAEAPGDLYVRLKSVSVSGGGMDAGMVDMQSDFSADVEYWVLQECRILISFHLHNARGEMLISSSNMTSVSATRDPMVERPFSPGLYRTSCVYPGRLFNNGDFILRAFIVDNAGASPQVHAQAILKFSIVDTGFMREEYQGPWFGNLRMKLPWSTEAITADRA